MAIDASRFFRCEETPSGQRFRVGAGDSRMGQAGKCIAVISLRHVPGYEVVLHLDNGRIDSFSPMQLFPETDHA